MSRLTEDIFPGYPYAFLQVQSAQASSDLLAKLSEFYQIQKQEHRKKITKKMEQMKSKADTENEKQVLEKVAKLQAEIEKEDTEWIKRNWLTAFDKRVRNCFYLSTNLDLSQLKGSVGVEQEVVAVDGAALESQGLTIIPDFVSEAQEKQLLESVYSGQFENLSMRRVQNFGFRFIFGPNLVQTTKPIQPIPEEFNSSLHGLRENPAVGNVFSGVNKWASNEDFFDQLTITEYKPGEGAPGFIESHKTFQEPIAIISLRSDCVMSFVNGISGDRIEVIVPRLSLVLLSGEMRYLYSQGVPTRKIDKTQNGLLFRKHRLTLTFRKTKSKIGCDCPYHQVCDDVAKAHDAKSSGIFSDIGGEKNQTLLRFEKEHVENVYNNIAEHFSHTRYKPWPRVYEFLMDLPQGSLVGDIGCGNGKYMFCGTGHHFLGVDVAVNFAKICKKKDFSSQVLVADSSMLPLRSDVLDHAISIAVIHHFVSHGSEGVRVTGRAQTAGYRGIGQNYQSGRTRLGVCLGS